GSGTAMQISLPAAGSRDTLEQSDPVMRAKGARRRVLIMDDEGAARTLTTNMLDFLGYDVDVTDSGSAAVERFKEALNSGCPFDAVLLDLMVPGDIGGVETMDRLAALDPEVKAILMSGLGHDPAVTEF